MSEQPTIHTERVDDVPLLLAHVQRLELPSLLDGHFPAHGNHQGLSLGWLASVWLCHILSQADHRLNRVRPWAEQLQLTLAALLPSPVRPTDFTDDRLADVLLSLSDDRAWAVCEGQLNRHILRVYDLSPSIVRVDGTTASGYWQVTKDGLFQFGHSKDHRSDQPQVKVMLATLDPLGLPVAVDVLPGQRSDDQLYLPIIARVRTSLERSGLLYVGDSKLGALNTRAQLHHAGDHYLCPLGRVQLDAAQLAELVEAALAAPLLTVIHRLTADGVLLVDDDGSPVVTAEAWESSAELTAEVEGSPLTWSERRVLVRSRALQASQRQALERRLSQAEADLAALLLPRRGKQRPTTPSEAEVAIAALLERHQVGGLVQVSLSAEAESRTVRAYRGQPTREETSYTLTLSCERDEAAIAAASERLGWQVYVTNRPVTQLSDEQVVLAYREQYLVEHPIGRLKGAPLSLSPVYLSRDEHVTGLVRLLTLGVRVLCALEYGVRQNLAKAAGEQAVSGLYAGQPTRQTRRPTAERVLEAFRNLTLTVVELPQQLFRHLTPLSELQQRLLALAGLEASCYSRLLEHSFEPPPDLSER
jgi:transposase